MKKMELLKVGTSAAAFCGMIALMVTMNSAEVMAASSSATGTAKAKIIEPITITAATANDKVLNFGTILSSSAHNVTVGTEGNRTSTVEGNLVNDTSNAPSAGEFTITSSVARNITLTLPSSATISGGSSSTNLTVSNFVSNPAAGTGTVSVIAGDTTVKVGATLAVTQGAAAGDYTGTYPVTISY